MKNYFNWRGRVVSICGALLLAGIGFGVGRWSVKATHPVLADHFPRAAVTNVVVIARKNAVVPASTAPLPGGDWSVADWRQLLSQPGNPARSAALAALLEKLAATDPNRAMAMAMAEGNFQLRRKLILSVLHGWARLAPLDAANWALSLPDSSDRDAALASVFAGAIATSPESAVAAGKLLMEENPAEAASCGSRLIDALCQSGDFAAAADLAMSGDRNQQNFWLGQAYSKWASFQPQAASQAAQAISDPAIRSEALHGVVGGWAEADPAGLVQFLSQLPAGTDRGQMLGQALKNWVQSDPEAAANWINGNNQFGSDLNEGAAEVATMESLPPQTAMTWAESITDPQLRSSTIAGVLRSWLDNDPGAAQKFFQTTTALLPADRQQLSQVIADQISVSMAQ